MPPPNPAAFNRYAQYVRLNLNTTSISATATAGPTKIQPVKLPSVGYGYRAFAWFDTVITVGDITGARLRSNDNIANTNLKFPAPWGFVRQASIEINGNGRIIDTPGYENYLLQLAANRGRKPKFGLDVWGSSVTGSRGFGTKEAQFGLTTRAGTTPLFTHTFLDDDSALVDSTDIYANWTLAFPLTLGESAVAGLIPWQDYRVQPILNLVYGHTGDMIVNPTNTSIAGTLYACVDYFEAPAGIRPDTRFIKQALFQGETLTGTGEKRFEPLLGGVMLRTFISLWHGSATDASQYAVNLDEQVSSKGTRIQGNTTLDETHPAFTAADELRWYSKFLPNNVLAWDHVASGFGDPGMPSLRDPIKSGRLTAFEYFYQLTALTTQGEQRAVYEQLLPAPRTSGA